MSTIESPTQISVSAEVDPTFSSLRVVLRPHEFKGPLGSNVGGQYRQVYATLGTLFSFDVPNGTRIDGDVPIGTTEAKRYAKVEARP